MAEKQMYKGILFYYALARPSGASRQMTYLLGRLSLLSLTAGTQLALEQCSIDLLLSRCPYSSWGCRPIASPDGPPNNHSHIIILPLSSPPLSSPSLIQCQISLPKTTDFLLSASCTGRQWYPSSSPAQVKHGLPRLTQSLQAKYPASPSLQTVVRFSSLLDTQTRHFLEIVALSMSKVHSAPARFSQVSTSGRRMS